ncbi:hypothetical protein F2Q68_00030980 [Brassica cretica]|uniref:Zinc knuckle CX2CX4HX4C domain-containing protein n=2 Tax=Brassica cretica TaxID=69181 RepID=A0A8S9GDZ0_BRACR|nr:hypothetical protein F2Q68_00030980 [Brassica cretica]
MDLPLQFRAAETFQSVGEAIGTVQGPVDLVAGRVRVEIDGFKPLVFSITVEFEEGVEITMGLRYEKLFGFCKNFFCLTHELSRCPELIKEEEVTLKVDDSGEDGMGATSFKAMVANESRQNGEQREGQNGRSQGFQGVRGSDKGKGIAREKQGFHKQEGAYHPYKEKFSRGYGEGSSFYGRNNRYGNKKKVFQTKDSQQQQQWQGAGEHRPINPTKLMLDAFKGVTGCGLGGVKGSGTDGTASSSKARKSLSFDQALPEVQSEEMGQMEVALTDSLPVQEQGELGAEAKAATEQTLHSEALDEANLMIDGVILSDSELQVEGDDLEDWEHGEIMDFAEEDALAVGDQDLSMKELGDQELGDQELGHQKLGAQEQDDTVDEVTVKVLEKKNGEEPNDEKAPKKKDMKQEAATVGGVKKRVGHVFASPRKKLLAKVAAKQGDKAKKGPPKA